MVMDITTGNAVGFYDTRKKAAAAKGDDPSLAVIEFYDTQ